MTLLEKFIQANENWEELLTAEPYNIKVNREDGFIIFKYNQIYSDFNNPMVRECRGIILDETTKTVVCQAMNKFGNVGESYCPEIDWSTASVQEKRDGSLMKAWCYKGTWHISTNNSINAFHAEIGQDILANNLYKSFGDLFVAALPMSLNDFYKELDEKYTYMFELTSPYNRVVIEYPEIQLAFLGVRDIQTGNELMPEATELYKKNIFIVPKRCPLHSYLDVKNAADALDWTDEGFVVCDGAFNRVKIKSPEYVKAHYARTTKVITKKALVEIIITGEADEFLIYAPDYREAFEEIRKEMEDFKADITVSVNDIKPETYTDKKEYFFAVNKYPEWQRSYLLGYYKLDYIYSKMSADKWIEALEARKRRMKNDY